MNQQKIREFLKLASSFRLTPIVDDDFPLMRDRFDNMLRDLNFAIAAEGSPFPEVVTLCGSTRFVDAYIKETRRLTLEGHIVISVGLFGHQEGLDMGGDTKSMLDKLHLRKIDLSDRIHIINDLEWQCKTCLQFAPFEREPRLRCKCPPEFDRGRWQPYVGESTRREIAYAQSKGLKITYLNPPEEP